MVPKVTTRNARFQHWQALLTNRATRQRSGEFLVHGVRPITLAVSHGWDIRAFLCRDGPRLSNWASGILDQVHGARFTLAPELMYELGEKEQGPPELVAVAAIPDDTLNRINAGPEMLVVVFDRPSTPGNVGALIRSADAFGASAMIVSGHGADPYDPKAVRASTGSLFALPVVRVASHHQVLRWVEGLRQSGTPVQVVATDEHAQLDVANYDFGGPKVLLVGNEARGLSAAWREASNQVVRVPVDGSVSSLNAAMAATVVLYEAARQRRR